MLLLIILPLDILKNVGLKMGVLLIVLFHPLGILDQESKLATATLPSCATKPLWETASLRIFI